MFNSAVFSEVKPAYEDDEETSTDSGAWPPSDDERAAKSKLKPVSIFTKKVKPKPPVSPVKPVKWQGAGRKIEPEPLPPLRRRSRPASVRSKSARGSPPPSPLLGPTGLFEDDAPVSRSPVIAAVARSSDGRTSRWCGRRRRS